jgi:hypothetical protein
MSRYDRTLTAVKLRVALMDIEELSLWPVQHEAVISCS